MSRHSPARTREMRYDMTFLYGLPEQTISAGVNRYIEYKTISG